MRRIAIVEDNQNDYLIMKSFFDRYQSEMGGKMEFQIVRFKSALTFLSQYDAHYDMVFMDIMLPDIDGLEASRRLRKLDENVVLIIVTNMAQFAVSGYEVGAFDYIVKPVAYSNFVLKLNRAMTSIKARSGVTLRINGPGGFVAINTNDIQYIETFGHNLIYHTKTKDYCARGSLKSVEEILPYNFKKCNRCYLVNLNYVTSLQDMFVYLGDTALQISQHKRTEFIHALNDWFNNVMGE